MIREEMLQHFVTLTTGAASTDAYGNPTRDFDNATEVTVKAWVQQSSNDETQTTEGDRLRGTWLVITNEPIDGYDRLTWNGNEFTVDGPTAPLYNRTGVHHYETTLTRVEG